MSFPIILIFTVLLTIVQATPPVPRQAPDSAAGTSGHVQKQGKSNNTPPTQTVPALKTDTAPGPETKSSDQSEANAEHPIIISKPVTMTILRDWFDFGIWVFNFLLVAVGVLQFLILKKQARIMGSHATELENLAEAAKINNKAAINTARPWLLVPLEKEFSEISNPPLFARLPGEYRRSYCTIRIKNFGRSPAQITEMKIWMLIGGYEDIPDATVYDSQDATKEDYVIPQGATMPWQAIVRPDGWITPQELEEITVKKSRYVWLCGYLRYRDTFDRKDAPVYETRICYRWVNDTNSPQPFWILAGPREYSKAK